MIRSPVVAVSEADVLVFGTPEELAAYAEPVDVEEGAWQAAWDRNGHRLQFSIVRSPYRGLFGRTRFVERVLVEPAPNAPTDDHEIQELVPPRLAAIGLDPGQLAGAELIEFAIAHVQPTT